MKDFVTQANEVGAAAQVAPSGSAGMITVFLGNNDVCTDELNTMTDPVLFEDQYRAGLDALFAALKPIAASSCCRATTTAPKTT